MSRDQNGSGYHILAAVGAESQLYPLLEIGCALATADGADAALNEVINAKNAIRKWLATFPCRFTACSLCVQIG